MGLYCRDYLQKLQLLLSHLLSRNMIFLKIFYMVGLSGCPHRDYEMLLER